MLGARDMAFPRLNALSYWVFLFAGIFLYSSFPFGQAPNAGWFNYVPLSGLEYNTGPNIDVYALGMVLLGISTTVGSVNFVVTLVRMRAPGMSINRVPVLVWGTLTASGGNLLAVPSVSLAFFMLWLDRQFGTHFFDVLNGGRPLLWQHMFWMFAHPWVYAVVLPAMGIVSDALPVFCRRPLVGYTPVALSTVATMVIGFIVWIHHMFATGIAAARAGVLRLGQHGDFDPQRGRHVRMDRDDLDRPSGVQGALLLFRGLRADVRDRRRVRRHDSRRAARLATHRYVLRRCASALRAARHQRFSGASAASITGFPSSPVGMMSERFGKLGFAGSCLSASTSASSRCTSRDCSACRGASTPIPPIWDGTPST